MYFCEWDHPNAAALKQFLQEGLPLAPQRTPRLAIFFEKYAYLRPNQLAAALKFGTPPNLEITERTDVYGHFRPSQCDTIFLSSQTVQDYVSGNDRRVTLAGSVSVLEATILHELVHWAVTRSSLPMGKKNEGLEAGRTFEQFVYGLLVE